MAVSQEFKNQAGSFLWGAVPTNLGAIVLAGASSTQAASAAPVLGMMVAVCSFLTISLSNAIGVERPKGLAIALGVVAGLGLALFEANAAGIDLNAPSVQQVGQNDQIQPKMPVGLALA